MKRFIIMATGKKEVYGYSKVMCNFISFRPGRLNISECSIFVENEVDKKVNALMTFWNNVPNSGYSDIKKIEI